MLGPNWILVLALVPRSMNFCAVKENRIFLRHWRYTTAMDDFFSHVGMDLRTEPGLLIALYLDGQAEVGQLHRRVLAFAGQEQVLWLERGRVRGGGC